MIAIPRALARRFRVLAPKCVVGRPRGPAPAVVVRRARGRVTLAAAFPDAALELSGPGPGSAEVLVIPMAVLDAIGGPEPEPVRLEPTGPGTGTARWTERGASRSVPVEFLVPGEHHNPLPHPADPAPVGAAFRAALHGAGRVTSRADGRYALSRVQVRGGAGQVVGTDGTVAVVFDGFALPFPGDVLVPALALFGCPEVRAETDVRVGRTAAHLVVSLGDVTVWLGLTAGLKFPDVSGAIPQSARTTVTLDARDAADLLAALPGLRGGTEEHRPVTLDADRVLTVRARAAGTNTARDLVLARSPVAGPAARVALNRRALGTMLGLGCGALRLGPDRPVAASGPGVTVLAAALGPDFVAPPTEPEIRPEPSGAGDIILALDERSDPMTPRAPARPEPAPGHPAPPPSDPPDPLVAAEDLRAALGDAAAKAARLVAALRAGRKEKKVLASVWAGLKNLNLGAR
ncbi:hypothetical protein J8F10_16505 [Gemmata sp. G18]|uniref:Uncharacterized protein n=1 Tax=Gemmata palustris TaxID=2822762 RepID=A0ABS5BT15_9BACT|nr:hypothetical protein [Gemmata palustris]MBP3956874.1 hypothetical protein [Gemmata palustris]